VPRRINLICSRLFLYGSLEELHQIGVKSAELVISELNSEQLLPAGIQVGNEFEQDDVYSDQEAAVSQEQDVNPDVQAEPVESTSIDLSLRTHDEPDVITSFSTDAVDVSAPATDSGYIPQSQSAFSELSAERTRMRYSEPSSKLGDIGLVFFSVLTLMLIFIIALYFVSPSAFIERTQKARGWIEQVISQDKRPDNPVLVRKDYGLSVSKPRC